MPRLARDDRSFVVLGIVRPGRSPLTGDTGLAASISTARQRLGLTTPSLGDIKAACSFDPPRVRQLLAEIQHAAAVRLPADDQSENPAPPTLILPVDQAEELFGSDLGAESEQFLSFIGHEHGLVVAVTIRTDRYEMMQTHDALASLNTRVFDDLKPMPPNQFREVIIGPADRASQAGHPLTIAPALVDRLLADAEESADALPMLSLTLARLYTDFGSSGELTLASYEAMGGMRKVVQNEVDEVLARDPEQRRGQLAALRRAFIPWLATVGPEKDQPVRRVANWTDLPEESRPLVDALVERRLLVKDTRDGETVVEVALESLLRQWDDLAGWLEDQRADLMLGESVERASAAWESSGRQHDWLLTGTRLADAEALVELPGFSRRLAATLPFLGSSRVMEDDRLRAEEEHRQTALRAAEERALNAQEREAVARAYGATLRKRSLVTTALAVLAVIVAVVAAVAFVQARNSRGEAQRRFFEATSARLVTDAQAVIAGTRPGNEIESFQLLLAADSIAGERSSGPLFSAVLQNVKLRKIIQTPAPVNAVAPNGDRYATGTGKSVQVWDSGTGQPVGEPLTGHSGAVTSVAFSPDGSRVVTGDEEGMERVWEAGAGRLLGGPLQVHDGAVFTVAFSGDGRRVASSGADRVTRVWSIASAEPLGPPIYAGDVLDVAFGRDGGRIVVNSWDAPMQVWDVTTGRPVGAPVRITRAATSVALSPDAARVVTGSEDATVRVWDAVTGLAVTEPFVGHTGRVTSVAFSPGGSRIVSGGDETVRVWDAGTGRPVGDTLRGRTGEVFRVGFSADGSRIVSASDNDTVRVWDPRAGTLTGHKWAVHSVAFSPDGSRIATAGEDATVRLWDSGTGQQIGEPLVGHVGPVTSVAFTVDGSRIASAGDDETVRVWDSAAGKPVGEPHPYPWTVTTPAFSPDGSRMVFGIDDTVQVWDVGTGQPVVEPFAGHLNLVSAAAFSPDGSRVVSGALDDTVRIWDVATGQPVGKPLSGHAGAVTSVAFSRDGSRVVSGGKDDTARVWDAATGEQIGDPLTGHTDIVTAVAFSPDGSRVVTGSQDSTLRLWEAATGRPIGEPLDGHTEGVTAVAYSPDGSRVASSSTDDTVRIWPAMASAADLCDKLTTNMGRKQWNEWVTPDIDYIKGCPDLPVPP